MAQARGIRFRLSESGAALGPAAVLLIAYGAVGAMSVAYTQPRGFAPIWFAVGLATAALLLRPRREWPALLVAVTLASVIINGAAGFGLFHILGFAVVSVLEPFLAAYWVRRALGERVDLTRVRDQLVFLGLAGALATFVTSVIATLMLSDFVPPTWRGLLGVWLDHALGVTVVGAVTLVWAGPTEPARSLRSLEGAAFGAVVVALVPVLAFASLGEHPLGGFSYLSFPLLFWAALRFGAKATHTALTLLVVYVAVLTLIDLGPFRSPTGDPTASLLLLQAFLVMLVLSTQIIAAAMEDWRRYQAALRQAEERYRAFIANSSEGILRVDVEPPMPTRLAADAQADYLFAHGRIAEANAVAARLFGQPGPEAIVGRPLSQVLPPEVCQPALSKFTARGYHLDGEECRFVRPGGSELWLSTHLTGAFENGRLTRIWASQRDVTERHRHLKALEYQAEHDILTALPNRAHMLAQLQQAVDDGRPWALLVVDLNRFREMNDALGHGVGDELLAMVADRLRRVAAASNAAVARMGGDEFALLVRALEDTQQATGLAEALLSAIREPLPLHSLAIELSASVGVVAYPEHGTDADTLLRRAEAAMYQAKQLSSGCVVYADELDPLSPVRLAVLTELGAALRRGELVLHYQPKIELASGAPTGLEALVRWNHPKHGLLPPARFVPIVELGEMIRPFTAWVLDQAMTQLSDWHSEGLSLCCAVNVSARNLLDERFARTVLDAVDRHGVAPDRLELEITETALMFDPERSLRVLTEIHNAGVRLSVDDFGTGYSALGYLRRLPVDTLKIDRSFVQGLIHNELDRSIVTSTINLAHDLGLSVVAEGVEHQVSLDLLRQAGCDQAQGFLISRPLPVGEVTPWVRERGRRTA